jgi:hypothetical protein
MCVCACVCVCGSSSRCVGVSVGLYLSVTGLYSKSKLLALAAKFLTKLNMTENGKQSSLLRRGMNYGLKKVYCAGRAVLPISVSCYEFFLFQDEKRTKSTKELII